MAAAAGLALAAASYAGEAAAWAWPMEDGATQAILKYEYETSDEAFDGAGERIDYYDQQDENVSLFLEHGLTRRITIQGKLGWTRGETPFREYTGRGPIELGARYLVFEGKRAVVSVYGGAVFAGEGRNGAQDEPGAADTDAEVRLLAGRSGKLWKRFHTFGELQLARLARQGLPDETRIEATVGVTPRNGWLLLAQSYAGQADEDPIARRWLKSEVSVVRDVGEWRLQAGWRWTPMGVAVHAPAGPVIALWRRF